MRGFQLSNYQTFFDKIHKSPSGVGVPGSAPIQAQISVSELRALHIHQYAPIPTGGMTPLDSVASSATAMRKGADWYRNNYNSGSDIPVDIMLSEMGPDWRLEGNIKWAGGWANFRTGLSWWNSWLRWLTLSASSDCRLQGWQSFTRFVYGCIHEASVPPHATYEAPAPSGRNQWYVDCDAWNTYVHYDVPHVGTGLPADGRYQGTFSAWDSVQWGRPPSSSADALWRRTPFAACYATWSRAGTQVTTGNLNTGWVVNTQAGVVGDADVYLPQAGYNTIYIPVFKGTGVFPANTQFTVQWVKPDGSIVPYTVTYMDLSEIQDTGNFSYNGYTQTVYSAMVWPFVCKVSSPRSVKLRLVRNASGPQVFIGKPVALPGMSSWLVTQ